MNHLHKANCASRAPVLKVLGFVVGLLLSVNASAQNLGTIFSDLWWNPLESGWGVTLDHQRDAIFATFFIYRDGSPYWVSATLFKVGTSGLGTFPQAFTGDLYETNGPSFGVPFNSVPVTNRKVGTATFTATNGFAGTLQYSIDGVDVIKNIERQTLRFINFTGVFLGGFVYTYYNCANPAGNNLTITDGGLLTITHSGALIRLVSQGQSTCTYNGTYLQKGRLGAVGAGSYTCTDGTNGTFAMSTMEWTAVGMTGLVAGQNQFCQFTGYFGGVTGGHLAP